MSPAARSSVLPRWEAAARLVADTRDLLAARPGASGGPPPHALARRGWDSFLLSLDDHELEAIETSGLQARWPERTPNDLRSLVERARDVCSVPKLSTQGPARGVPAAPRQSRGLTPRKRAQVDAFGRLVIALATGARRVVDVGSGHGHLTRELARCISLPVVGLERDAAIARRARTLSSDPSDPSSASPRFAVTDVLGEGLALSAGDCVIGLHACGELGDVMVTSVARLREVTLALVACCMQKRRAVSRLALCDAPGLSESLDLPKGLLGLSNLVPRDEGVEATRADNLAARERRLALNRLLSDGRAGLRLGAEIAGLNRRTAQRDLTVLVARAFALRGRPIPSRRAIDDAEAWARAEHARARRLSVPRAMLARVLEVYVLLDRGAYLDRHGFTVEVGELFPGAVSPRNLVLVAR